MNFASDNVTGASQEILAAIAAANEGAAMPYGDDPITRRLEGVFNELFEREVISFPVATGSAANSLALATMTPPYGAVYCHPASHINTDECGAPEFYTGGAKLIPIAGENGKITVAALEHALANSGKGNVHHVQPSALSLTNETEVGTLYRVDEVSALAACAHAHGLYVHMDGARFANAIVALGSTPAELTWRAGVDALSFGATKNGAIGAEAVVFFEPKLAESFGYRRKRGAHLFSKMRFVSAQLEAYCKDGLWLRHACHANAMAKRLSGQLQTIPGVELVYPVEANEIFARIPGAAIEGAFADGFFFYRRVGETDEHCRLVTAFNTKPEDVDGLIASLRRHANTGTRRRA
ncbi:MAG TPA: low specificity L-threonine aldolase [Alphaproteobacteria bacterium]|nr:low specificity L-threonine aldolase [Alphaproteobacteria bacterium]